MGETYSDVPTPKVKTGGSASPSRKEWLLVHIDNADPDILPLKLAIEQGWQIYIHGPDNRANEIQEMTRELAEDFTMAQGIVGVGP